MSAGTSPIPRQRQSSSFHGHGRLRTHAAEMREKARNSHRTRREAHCCLIYCRVSTPKQITEGDGLRSQESRCRSYAAARGYQVIHVFTDGITGEEDRRPGFLQLLRCLDGWDADTALGPLVVLIDDIKRFAREVEVHFDLKAEIVRRGGRLESPGFQFEDTPTGKFIETVMAAGAELERNQNKEQVCNRMRARLEAGYWAFNTPPGYRYVRHPYHKKLLVPDDTRGRAALMRDALEGFATDRFARLMDVLRFLENSGFWGPAPERRQISRHLTQIASLLRMPLYAGYVEYSPWGISLRPGQHEALIRLETFDAIQHKLARKNLPPAVSSPSSSSEESIPGEAFVLRGFVACVTCGRPFTASWSRGKMGGRYGYYHCAFRGCPLYGKTISWEEVHQGFERILTTLQASDEDVAVMRSMALEWLENRRQHQVEQRAMAAAELANIEKRAQALLEKIEMTQSPVVMRTLEQRIEELEAKRFSLREAAEPRGLSLFESDKRDNMRDNMEAAGTLFDEVSPLLKNPYRIYESANAKTRRILVRAVLAEPVRYERGRGFGTPDFTLPYRISRTLAGSDSILVDPSGVSWNHEVLDELWEYLSQWEKTLFLQPGSPP